MKYVLLFLVAAMPSFGQATIKKTAPPTAKPDTWQKSKECAAQAEKVMAERERRMSAKGSLGDMDWENHYSPKYNKCFISATYFNSKGGKDLPAFTNTLVDAFERSTLAQSASAGQTDGFCKIDDKATDCAQAEKFISEHMKN
jgi:hypothetical protein